MPCALKLLQQVDFFAIGAVTGLLRGLPFGPDCPRSGAVPMRQGANNMGTGATRVALTKLQVRTDTPVETGT